MYARAFGGSIRRGWASRVWASPTLRFFLLGAVLLVGRAAVARFSPHPRPEIEVIVPPDLAEADVRRRVEEAIMVEEGIRFGWAESDPIVRRRLAMNMAFAVGEAAPANDAAISSETIDEALALGMARSDPVVRRRLIDRMERILGAPHRDDAPDDATLAAHIAAHRARFERPARVALVHVLLRRDRHVDLAADASALLERLRREEVSVERAPSLGDPIPLLPPRQRASVVAFDRRFGAGFGEAVAHLALGEWAGPVASSYGLHLVFVESREASRLPPLEVIRPRALADYLDELRHARLAQRLAALRDRYDIHVVHPRGAS
jgi:hypothetical protein